MRASESDLSVRQNLLLSAKQEFFERGYEKASLRKISARAGVTTGAIYFFFQNKTELFEQVVQETLDKLEILSVHMAREELEHPDVGVDNEERLLRFLWENKECVSILLDKSQGTRYENFGAELEQQLEAAFAIFFQKYGVETVDQDLVHILVKMKMQGYRTLIEGGYPLERILELSRKIGWYTDGGFLSLMKNLNDVCKA